MIRRMAKSSDPSGTHTELQRGECVYLRLPAAADCDEYLNLRRVSAEFHAPWEPRPSPGVDLYSRESFERYLRDSDSDHRLRSFICRCDDQRIVGAMNWNEIVRGPLQSAYLGYWIGAPFARRGYMHDGLRLALRHSFEGLGLHRVEANVRPENEASVALVRRAGFRLEGYSPRYLEIAGEWCDHERWAMLVDDWNELQRA
jgi:[ribosomal protein S5]-alanine N-acetyltransferase